LPSRSFYRPKLPIVAPDGFLDFCDRDLDILERQLLPIQIELLRSRPKTRPAQLVQQVLKPRLGFFEKGVLGCEVEVLCCEIGVLCFEIGLLGLEMQPRLAFDVELKGRLGERLACASNAARRSAGNLSRRAESIASTMREA
jgi:hypothetical protein